MRKGMRLLAAVSALTLLLGGCGTPMYELTDEEENLVVQGAAYMLARYNIYQKDGMNAAQPKPEEDTTTEDTTTEQNDEPDAQTPQNSGTGSSNGDGAATVSGGQISLAESIGYKDELTVTYKDYSLMDIYEEGTYFSLSADDGKTFAVLHFEIENTSSGDITIDNFDSGCAFYLSFRSAAHIPEKQSFIADSLATFDGTIPAGKTAKAVLIFEITKEQAEELSEPTLTMEKDNTSFSVNI